MNREQEPQGLGPEAHDSPRSSHIGFGSVQMIMNITRAADSAEEPQPSGALIQELLLELTHLVQHLQQDCSSTPGAPDNGTPGSSSSSNSNLSSTSCSDWVSSLRIRLAQVDQQLLAAPGWEQHPDALMTQQRVLVELQQAVQLLSPPRLHPQEQQEPPAWIMLPPCLPLATMEQPTPAAAAAPAAVGAAEGTEGAQQQQQGGRCGAAATAGPCAKETQVMVYCGNAREAQLGSSVRTVVQRSGELVLDTGADVQAATMHPDGPVCGVIRWVRCTTAVCWHLQHALSTLGLGISCFAVSVIDRRVLAQHPAAAMIMHMVLQRLLITRRSRLCCNAGWQSPRRPSSRAAC